MQDTPDYRIGISYLIAFSSALGSLNWGYCLGIFNSVRSYFQTHLFPDASQNEIAFMASSLVIGAAFGAFSCGKIVNNIGRRKTLLLVDLASIVGAILSMIQILPLIIVGRFISGLVLGINSVAVPLYNVEMAPLRLKGTMGTISMVMVASGTLLAFAMSFFVPNGEDGKDSQIWRLIIGLPILFNIGRILSLVFIFKYETPLYLAIKGDTEQARASLEIVYTSNIDQHMQKVLKDKEAMSSSTGSLTLTDLLTPKYRRAFLMGFIIAAILQLTGFSPIFMFFNLFAAESANNDPATLALFSTLLGLISFIFIAVTAFVVEKFGRRPIMVYGTLFLFINEVLYLLVSAIGGPAHGSLKYLLILWPIFYRLSAGTLGFVYISELLPTVGVAFAMFMNWVWSFALVQTLLPLANMIGVQGLMFFYAVFSLFAFLFFYKYLIESKGRTKAELLELYRVGPDQANQNNDTEMQKIPLLQK